MIFYGKSPETIVFRGFSDLFARFHFGGDKQDAPAAGPPPCASDFADCARLLLRKSAAAAAKNLASEPHGISRVTSFPATKKDRHKTCLFRKNDMKNVLLLTRLLA